MSSFLKPIEHMTYGVGSLMSSGLDAHKALGRVLADLEHDLRTLSRKAEELQEELLGKLSVFSNQERDLHSLLGVIEWALEDPGVMKSPAYAELKAVYKEAALRSSSRNGDLA